MDTASVAMAQNAADRAATHADRAAEAARHGWARLAALEAGLAGDCAEDAETALTVVLSIGEHTGVVAASIAVRDAWVSTARAAYIAMDAWHEAHALATERFRASRDVVSELHDTGLPRDPPPTSQ